MLSEKSSKLLLLSPIQVGTRHLVGLTGERCIQPKKKGCDVSNGVSVSMVKQKIRFTFPFGIKLEKSFLWDAFTGEHNIRLLI